MQLLRARIASGEAVARLSFAAEPREPPTYRVVLARGRELTDVRVPHSDAFMRWCFENGLRMDDAAAEARRFSQLLVDRLEPLRHQWGDAYFGTLLAQRLQALEAPSANRVLGGSRRPSPLGSGDDARAAAAIDAAIAELARRLGTSLKYSDSETAQILDEALARAAYPLLGLQAPAGSALPT